METERLSLWELYGGGGPGGTSSLLVTPKNMLSKALEMGVCFYRGPILGDMRGRYFPRAFERRDTFHFMRRNCMKNSRDM
jgi:hypothetical protein